MEKLPCILLIDDDKITNYLNTMLLEDLDIAHQVLIAENGLEALRLLQQHSDTESCPDLILLDINMPVMNGFEFLEAYQTLEFTRKQSVVIVMLTTSLNPQDVNRLRSLPQQGFLNKPLSRQKMQDLLKQYFQRELPA